MRQCRTAFAGRRQAFSWPKESNAATLLQAALAAILAPAKTTGNVHALRRRKRQCPALLRGGRKRNADPFLHEFAADHTNWEPQMRYFSRGHRCIAYSARGYRPSDVPPSPDVYSYKHFYTDALAVLDHLKIERAHFVGLSMGSYSSLHVSLQAPERMLSMTLAGVGSGSSLENLDAWRKQCRENAEQFERLGSVEVAKVTREAPGRIPFLVKDPRGHADFYAALARHDAKGSANTMRGFQGGRPSIYTLTEAIRKVPTPALIICGDEDDACIESSLFLKKHLPAAGLTLFPKSGHVLNLEEPALFNAMVERFTALVGAGRWGMRDPRSMVAAG
jgi:3-oxoadipate enol-lactonase